MKIRRQMYLRDHKQYLGKVLYGGETQTLKEGNQRWVFYKEGVFQIKLWKKRCISSETHE